MVDEPGRKASGYAWKIELTGVDMGVRALCLPDPRSRACPFTSSPLGVGWGGVGAMDPTGCPCVQAIPGGYRSLWGGGGVLTLKC